MDILEAIEELDYNEVVQEALVSMESVNNRFNHAMEEYVRILDKINKNGYTPINYSILQTTLENYKIDTTFNAITLEEANYYYKNNISLEFNILDLISRFITFIKNLIHTASTNIRSFFSKLGNIFVNINKRVENIRYNITQMSTVDSFKLDGKYVDKANTTSAVIAQSSAIKYDMSGNNFSIIVKTYLDIITDENVFTYIVDIVNKMVQVFTKKVTSLTPQEVEAANDILKEAINVVNAYGNKQATLITVFKEKLSKEEGYVLGNVFKPVIVRADTSTIKAFFFKKEDEGEYPKPVVVGISSSKIEKANVPLAVSKKELLSALDGILLFNAKHQASINAGDRMLTTLDKTINMLTNLKVTALDLKGLDKDLRLLQGSCKVALNDVIVDRMIGFKNGVLDSINLVNLYYTSAAKN